MISGFEESLDNNEQFHINFGDSFYRDTLVHTTDVEALIIIKDTISSMYFLIDRGE